MRCKKLFFLLIFLLILAACAEKECREAADCTAKPVNAFTPSCVDDTCKYEPIPNVCGNENCEEGENKCNCQQDCGVCTGKVPETESLVQSCVAGECVETVLETEPIFNSDVVASTGDRFALDTIYNKPFNLNADTYGFTITLRQKSDSNQDHNILRATLTGRTRDRRTITLGTKEINKPLWGVGSSIEESMVLDFPTVEKEAQISNLVLAIDYEYASVVRGQRSSRQSTLKQTFTDRFTFVNPQAPGRCPESCDDENPGTEDKCGEETDFFCIHEPIPNTCGNYRCEAGETRCTCARDCGPCSGSAGTYLDYTCKLKTCVTVQKPEVTVQPNNIFDERSFGPVQLSNKYGFPNPFDVTKDRLDLEFAIYQKDETVGDVIIEKVRLIEGQQEITEVPINRKLSTSPSSVSVKIPELAQPEEERRITLGVWYAYTKDGQTRRGNYQKQLDKIAFIQPG